MGYKRAAPGGEAYVEGGTAAKYTGQIRLREGLAYALAAVLPPVLSFVRVPLYSRWFTPQVYGEFTLAVAAAALGNSLVSAVFQNTLLRYYDVHRRTGSLGPFLASLAVGVVASFGAVGVTALMVTTLWRGDLWVPIPWAFALFVIASVQGFLGQINRLEHQPAAFVAGRLIDPLWQLGAPVALLSLGFPGEPTIFATAVVAGLSSVIVGAIWARRQVALAKPWEARSYLLSQALRYGAPLIPSALVNWVMSSSDRYMLKLLLGSESTGIYAMGYGLAWTTVATMASALLMVMVPSVWERVNALGAAEGVGLVRSFARFYLGLAIPAALGLAVLGPRIVDGLLTPQYASTARVVGPVAFAAVFGGLHSFLVKPWELHEATMQLPAYVGIGAGLSVVLNLWMVRTLGIAGPAWSALVAHGAVSLMLIFQAKRRYHVFVGPSIQDIWAIGLPSVLMVAVIRVLDRRLPEQGIPALVAIIAVGAGVYLAGWLPFQGDLRRWLSSSRKGGRS